MALATNAAACQPGLFSPTLPGAEIQSIQAQLVTNYSTYVLQDLRFVAPAVQLENAEFCNVTVTYTHTCINDTINVEAWLPTQNWNERLQAVGGGGWVAGRFYISYETMAGALADGYATVTTDAGLGTALSPETWALIEPGVVNIDILRDLAYISLGDEAVIAKSLIQSFYGKPAIYSYWNGCSQGGRQGLALAQLYPDAYDGISAGAPAIHLPSIATNIYWPQQYMNDIQKYPYNCELDEVTKAAILYCDAYDGVIDGIISRPDSCDFDPMSAVGQVVNCSQTGTYVAVSEEAARVVQASWNGITSAAGKKLWYGFQPGADLSGLLYPSLLSSGGPATTQCSGETCQGAPSDIGTSWLRLFLAKDPSFNLGNMTQEEFEALYQVGLQEYSALLDTAQTDLSAFQNSGGKIISFHGLADQIIPDENTRAYYNAVSSRSSNTADFFRYFPIPGLGHCYGGQGGQPINLFEQLRAWVENGTAPTSSVVSYSDSDGDIMTRILCPYPQTTTYNASCGDSNSVSCWTCESK